MSEQHVSLGRSWSMLTRDKGWIKPLLILTAVGWIPVVGQIAILGYALEWSRLTAWGANAAPKRRDIDYGKLFSTGGSAFLIGAIMNIPLLILDALLFDKWWLAGMGTPFNVGLIGDVFDGGYSAFSVLLMLALHLAFGFFMTAAAMRATLYDSFSAGWRFDRLFQMVERDAKGFFSVCALSLVCSLINWVYTGVVAVVIGMGAAVAAGVIGVGVAMGHMGYVPGIDIAYGVTPGMLMVAVVVAVALLFVGALIAVVTQLLSVNLMGQWFARFEVARWGTSSDPLPADVPASYGRAREQAVPPQAVPVPPQPSAVSPTGPYAPSGGAADTAPSAGRDVAAAGTGAVVATEPQSCVSPGAAVATNAVSGFGAAAEGVPAGLSSAAPSGATDASMGSDTATASDEACEQSAESQMEDATTEGCQAVQSGEGEARPEA